MSVEKEKGHGGLEKNSDGNLCHWDMGLFSLLFPNIWRRHRRETDSGNRQSMGKKMREFNLIYLHDFSMFWLYGSNIPCHYCLASHDQGKVKAR